MLRKRLRSNEVPEDMVVGLSLDRGSEFVINLASEFYIASVLRHVQPIQLRNCVRILNSQSKLPYRMSEVPAEEEHPPTRVCQF